METVVAVFFLFFVFVFRIVDSMQECCHCNDSVIVITSINLVNDLMNSVEQLISGRVVPMEGTAVVKSGLFNEYIVS